MKPFKVGERVTVRKYRGESLSMTYNEILDFGGPEAVVIRTVDRAGYVGIRLMGNKDYSTNMLWVVKGKHLKRPK